MLKLQLTLHLQRTDLHTQEKGLSLLKTSFPLFYAIKIMAYYYQIHRSQKTDWSNDWSSCHIPGQKIDLPDTPWAALLSPPGFLESEMWNRAGCGTEVRFLPNVRFICRLGWGLEHQQWDVITREVLEYKELGKHVERKGKKSLEVQRLLKVSLPKKEGGTCSEGADSAHPHRA